MKPETTVEVKREVKTLVRSATTVISRRELPWQPDYSEREAIKEAFAELNAALDEALQGNPETGEDMFYTDIALSLEMDDKGDTFVRVDATEYRQFDPEGEDCVVDKEGNRV